MTEATIGIIGSGRVARTLLEGWTRAGKSPQSITVSDPNADSLAQLKARFPKVATTSVNAHAVGRQIVFLAVHPPAMSAVLQEVKAALAKDAVVISLAPKITTDKLTALLGGFKRVVRVIPNAPSVMGLGYNPVSFAPDVSDADKQLVMDLLSPLGECPEVPEEKLEAYAVISAMGPTYFWFQLQCLRELGQRFGLSNEELVPALKRMVYGSTRTLLESGLSASEVMDLVPVKPLGEMEAHVLEMYRTRLPAIYKKIKP